MKAVTLFSGCGGLDLGLRSAGFEILLASDLSPECEASYAANFGSDHFVQADIASIDHAFLKQRLGDSFGTVDLLAGGPPCPPYSKSRFYRKEKPRGIEDDLGDLTLRGYLRALEALRPRAFLLENVAGFAYHVHRAGLELVLDTALKLGYECSWKIVNSADYGVPQIRERFFLVGVRDEGVFAFPAPTHSSPKSTDLFSQTLLPWRTAGEVLTDLDTDDDDTGHRAGGKHRDLLRLVPPGDNYLYFTEERGCPDPIFRWRSRYWSFLLKLSPDMPSWTIQARRSNNMGPFHWRNRILRISEVKRLQGFPDNWHLCGNVDQQWRQVGNAVPPPIAFALASAIREQLGERDGEEGSEDTRRAQEAPEHERVLAGHHS